MPNESGEPKAAAPAAAPAATPPAEDTATPPAEEAGTALDSPTGLQVADSWAEAADRTGTVEARRQMPEPDSLGG